MIRLTDRLEAIRAHIGRHHLIRADEPCLKEAFDQRLTHVPGADERDALVLQCRHPIALTDVIYSVRLQRESRGSWHQGAFRAGIWAAFVVKNSTLTPFGRLDTACSLNED